MVKSDRLLEPAASAQATISGTFQIGESERVSGTNKTASVSAQVARGTAASTSSTNGSMSVSASSTGIGLGHNVGASAGFRMSYEAIGIPDGTTLQGHLLGRMNGSGAVRTSPFSDASIAVASYRYNFRASGNGDSSSSVGGLQWVGEGGSITTNSFGRGTKGTITADLGITVEIGAEFLPTGARRFAPTAQDWAAWGLVDPSTSVFELANFDDIDSDLAQLIVEINKALRLVGVAHLGIGALGSVQGVIGVGIDVDYNFVAETSIALSVSGGRSGVLLGSVSVDSITTLTGLEAIVQISAAEIADRSRSLALHHDHDSFNLTAGNTPALFDRFEVPWDTPYDLQKAQLVFEGVGSVPIVRALPPVTVPVPPSLSLVILAVGVLAASRGLSSILNQRGQARLKPNFSFNPDWRDEAAPAG